MSDVNGADELTVVGLIEFLKELDSTRNPPIYDITTERLYELEGDALAEVPGVALTPAAPAWLTVSYLDLPIAPVPTKAVSAALSAPVTAHTEPTVRPLDDLLRAARHVQAQAEGVSEDGVTLPAEGEQEIRRAHAEATAWIASSWAPWAQAYLKAEKCKGLYRDLFEQQAQLSADRDSIELVWGFGRVKWNHPEGVRVDAPLLAVPVEITLDEENQALSVTADGALGVQVEYLSSLTLHDRPGLLASRDAVLAAELDPWGEELPDTLRRIVRHLDLGGVINGEGATVPGAPVMHLNWVLYMRRRRPNYQAFLDALKAMYRDGAEVPLPLQTVVDDLPTGQLVAERNTLPAPRDPLLLPLPANEEQLQILRLAQDPSGVVVQGPPGTGKTHTIANIISHYVAYGKRVLVLAEKERALHEVSGKIPEGIRALTVSVLGADEDSRRQLGASIAAIQNRVTGLDRDAADAEIVRLTALLSDLDGQIAATTSQMLRTRKMETQTLDGAWPCDRPVTPQRAAQWLAANEETLRRIPDRLTPSTACPITASELGELTALIGDVGAMRAAAALEELPDLAALPSPAELAGWHTTLSSAADELSFATERITSFDEVDALTPDVLEGLAARATTLEHALAACETGWLAAVTTQLRDPLLVPEWQQFCEGIRVLREQVISLRYPLAGHEVVIPRTDDEEFSANINKAVEALAGGGKLGLFARGAKSALESCRIDHVPAKTHEHAVLIQTALTAAKARQTLTLRWRNQVSALGGPDLSSAQPEAEVRELLATLHSAVHLEATWKRLTGELAALHIYAGVASVAEAQALRSVLASLPARVRQRQAEQSITNCSLELRLRGAELAERTSPLFDLLADTIEKGETARYAEHRDRLADLITVRASAQRLRDLRRRLGAVAPAWLGQILADPAAAGSIEHLGAYWQFRQLDTWVADILTTTPPGKLQRHMHASIEERRRVVGELVTQRAWRRLADNLGDRERRGLNTYLQAVQRYGKTGGKYEARRIAEIRRAMDECKHAVPVWVMTSARALTSFQPEAVPPFDVLILDEASQASYSTLPLLSLAKQVIVVGDEKQTSPENVGLARARVFELMEDHLRAVRGYRTLFDPDNSLYDIARQRFTKSVMLVEHFRCLPDIIKFSNSRFYNDEIQPLRDRPPMLGWQSLGAVRVLDGYRSGDTNRPEADAVVELLARLDADERYDGMSFGVVTLLAGGQAKLVHELAMDRLAPERFRGRHLQVGDAAAFQGAERDVIVISLVVAPDPNNPERKPGAATREADYRRLNVAATRAKQQLWVAYSVEPERFSANDLRSDLIRHCRDPHAIDSGGQDVLVKCDSEFERRVATHILNRGFRRLRAQHPVGSESRNYRIDLVVEGPSGRLAVECDGERWHGPDRWHADHARQQVLERAGWTFERIRGSAFFRDEQAALEPLWQRLDELGIAPGDDGDAPTGRQVFDVLTGRWRTQGESFDDGTTGDIPLAPRRVASLTTLAAQGAPATLTAAKAGGPGASTAPAREPESPEALPSAPAVVPTQNGRASAPSPAPASLGALYRRPATARDEILLAAQRVMARTGRENFTATEILEDLRQTRTSYAEGTIKTMISFHLVTDGSLHRVARGLYRLSGHSPALVAKPPLPAPNETSTPARRCQNCGKEGLISNTVCRKCRNGAVSQT